MLQWLRKRPTTYPDQIVVGPVDVAASRKVGVFCDLSSPKEARLRSLFETDHYQSPAVSARHLSDCIIDVESGLVVRSDGSLDETCRHIASYYTDTEREGLAAAVQASATSVINDDLIHVFHRSCGAYGHFILDGLSAVAVMAEVIRARRLKILVRTSFPAWMTDILASIGFGPDQIVKASGVVRCRSMITSTMLAGGNCFLPNPDIIAKLQKLVDSPKAGNPHRRIYLTRESAYSPRFVDNEEAVQGLFRKNGFEIVSPTALGFRGQIELFASAAMVAGNHGSAFANMVFSSAGTHIIDLMPEDWVGYWGDTGTPERWLLNLTGACGHDYALVLSPSAMTGSPYLPNSSTELARIDTTVDLKCVEAAIEWVKSNR